MCVAKAQRESLCLKTKRHLRPTANEAQSTLRPRARTTLTMTSTLSSGNSVKIVSLKNIWLGTLHDIQLAV